MLKINNKEKKQNIQSHTHMSLMPTLTRINDTQHKQIRTQNIADVGYHMASSDYTIHLRSHNKCSILAYVATSLFCAFRPV